MNCPIACPIVSSKPAGFLWQRGVFRAVSDATLSPLPLRVCLPVPGGQS